MAYFVGSRIQPPRAQVISAFLLLLVRSAQCLEMKTLQRGSGQPALQVKFDGRSERDEAAGPDGGLVVDDHHYLASLSGAVQMSVMQESWLPGWFRRFVLRAAPEERMLRLWCKDGESGDCLIMPEGTGVAIEVVDLTGEDAGLYVSRGGGLIAREESVKPVSSLLDAKGLKQLGNLGPGAKHFGGRGQVALAAFGGILRLDLKRGEERLVKVGSKCL